MLKKILDDHKTEQETLRDYLLVENIHNFENIGVTNKINNIKYLICADCEKGPVGWYDLSTSISYIALSRVKYENAF